MPVGHLAEHWNNDAAPGVLEIIDVARTLYDLFRTRTTRSAPLLLSKVRQLLRTADAYQYTALIAELRVGALLGLRAGPVALEPLTPEDLIGSAKQPRGPDFAIRIPGGDVFFEVTVVRVDAFERWERALRDVQARFDSVISGAGLHRVIEVSAPLGVRADQLSRKQFQRFAQALKQKEAGSMALSAGPQKIQAKWTPMPVIEPSSGRAVPPSDFPAGMAVGKSGPGVQIMSSFGYSFKVEIGPEARELLLRSLRNTVDGKKAQFSRDMLALLVLQSGERRLGPQNIHALVEKRLWPNSTYSWLTGVGIFVPRRTFGRGESPRLLVTWNPKAKRQPTAALKAMVEEGAVFSKGVRVDRPQ